MARAVRTVGTAEAAGADDGAIRAVAPAEAARETLAARRSEQLLHAAARLMERDGSQAVSMQAVADEAAVSVGLIYRYFGGKQDLLLAVIVDVLDTFAAVVPAAVEASGDDPVDRVAAAFRAYCEVIDTHRHAAVLTYRESKLLTPEGLARIKELEVATAEPLRRAVRDGVEAGLLTAPDPDLVAYDLLLLAHAWALKHWWFQARLTLDEYVRKQTALVLSGVVEPRRRRSYRRHLDPDGAA